MGKRSSSIANKIYIFVHHNDEWIETNIKGREFNNSWANFDQEGRITLKGSNADGYAWDGCSPKWNCLHLLHGTPDGKLDLHTEKRITYFGSMIHDVLYQFKDEIDISRKEADIIFKQILKQAGFMWWWLYYAGVRVGGAFYGKWRRKNSMKGIMIRNCSWL